MRLVRAAFALFLAALWLPASLHCALERSEVIPTSADLCCDSDDRPGGNDHDRAASDCAADTCGVVESGAVKTASAAVKVPPAVLVICLSTSELIPEIEPPASPLYSEIHDRLALPNTWQFAVRAAPPARAPALS